MPGIARGVGEERDVIDGVGPGVVQVEVQTVGDVLLQGQQQAVVAGKSFVAVERVLRELGSRSYVERSTGVGDELDRVTEIARSTNEPKLATRNDGVALAVLADR